MKKKNIKQSKNVKPGIIKYTNEDTDQIKKFIIILVGIAVIAILLYFITAKYLVKDKFQDEVDTKETTIVYDTIKIGSVFNRPYDTYYVLAYDSTDSLANYYLALRRNFSTDEKVYFLDLSIGVNKNYVSEAGNKSATNASELSLVNPTLILIKDGKISKYYEGKDEVTAALE